MATIIEIIEVGWDEFRSLSRRNDDVPISQLIPDPSDADNDPRVQQIKCELHLLNVELLRIYGDVVPTGTKSLEMRKIKSAELRAARIINETWKDKDLFTASAVAPNLSGTWMPLIVRVIQRLCNH
jgi:hypothetical protein